MDPSPAVEKADPDESKACADCHTTKTPLWRGGPAGPKSLCNACGIRYRKRRRQALGLDATAGEHKKPKKEKKAAASLTVELAGFLKQRRRMRRSKCLGEEERAAILLMALSSGGGVIYA